MFEQDQITQHGIMPISPTTAVDATERARADIDHRRLSYSESSAERAERDRRCIEEAQKALDRYQRRTIWQRIRAFITGEQSC